MKIINKTYYRTDQLRAIVSRVAANETTAEQRKHLKVYIVPSRGGNGSSGLCYGRHKISVTICTTRSPHLIDFAATIAHELHHAAKGENGRAAELWMRKSWRYGYPRTEEDKQRQREYYAWVTEMPLERKPDRKKKPALPADEKHRQALERLEFNLKQWQSKLKRCNTAIKKYRRLIKYREQKLAACPKGGEQ